MKNAIIVHGKPSREKYESSETDPSDSHWIPWAKHQLNIAGIRTVAPDMPVPYYPDYREWEIELDRHKPWQPETSLIGLSAGASLVLRYSSEYEKLRYDKIILVAPWLDIASKYGDFGNFEIDPHLSERCIGGLAVFYSSKDDDQALASLEVIQAALPNAKYIDIPGYGHYMTGNKMETNEFPELIAEML
ncbi:alpha/beta hydrolase [Candidatus Saccharibacteria bacterium]|nr:alpha/beta hydrolase [Candidatus Saccharibacteria bacterium]